LPISSRQNEESMSIADVFPPNLELMEVGNALSSLWNLLTKDNAMNSLWNLLTVRHRIELTMIWSELVDSLIA